TAALLDLALRGALIRAGGETAAALLTIDVMNLALAAGFLALGRAARRRARDGQPNSVWALRPANAQP
ncbi:MAG: hypothetical protein QM639_20520, partial [Rhodocyclaceae bacterium]